jgi:hypothetical protein
MVLNKRFYDLISILFIILIAGLTYYRFTFVQKMVFESGSFGTIAQLVAITILSYILVFAYWLFILILAIRMNSHKLIKVIDVVIIAIFIPLSIFFYFLTLRQHMKKMPKYKFVMYSLL